jgi:hypothetical protein
MIRIGDPVEAWHNDSKTYKKAVVLDIRRDVVCCKGIPGNEHIHPILFDVVFDDDAQISHGHFPESIRKVEIKNE